MTRPDAEEEVIEWTFPNLEVSVDMKMLEPTIEVDANSCYLAEKYASVTDDNAEQAIVDEAPATPVVEPVNAALNVEVELLKEEYQKKIDVMNGVITRLQHAADVFDNEIMDYIQLIIKKVTKKIIMKELEANPDQILAMAKEIGELIQAKEGILQIKLSEVDYNRLDLKEEKYNNLVMIDPSLSEGDVIVSTEFTEVRAKLAERIDQIMGDIHDE